MDKTPTKSKSKRKTPGKLIPLKPTIEVKADLREMILTALHKSGGVNYLVEQAANNPKAFLALLSRVIPKDLSADININGSNVQINQTTTFVNTLLNKVTNSQQSAPIANNKLNSDINILQQIAPKPANFEPVHAENDEPDYTELLPKNLEPRKLEALSAELFPNSNNAESPDYAFSMIERPRDEVAYIAERPHRLAVRLNMKGPKPRRRKSTAPRGG